MGSSARKLLGWRKPLASTASRERAARWRKFARKVGAATAAFAALLSGAATTDANPPPSVRGGTATRMRYPSLDGSYSDVRLVKVQTSTAPPAASAPQAATTPKAASSPPTATAPPAAIAPPAATAPKADAHSVAAQKATRAITQLGNSRLWWDDEAGTRLVGVELRGDQATDANLALVGRCPDIRTVVLSPSRPGLITDAGLRHLQPLDLHYLGLGNTAVTDRGLAQLAHWKHLRRLELPAGATDDGLQSLLELPELEQLRVWPAKVSNQGLATIGQLACLRFLDLNGSPVDDAGLPPLAALTSLEVLDLRRTSVTDGGLVHLISRPDADCMYLNGPHHLRKVFLPNRTRVRGDSVESLIRFLGVSEIETARPQAEPGKPPLPAETIVPELTATWLERAMLEGFREEISHWKALGAYVEFTDKLLDDDFVATLPKQLLERRPTPEELQQLTTAYRDQAYRHIAGLYFTRPRTKDDRPRDDRVFPVTLGQARLPPRLERLSLRDTEVSASTVASVIVPSMRAGVPLKVLNVFNTSAPGVESVTKEGFRPILGSPGTDLRPHLPFNPGQPGVTVPPIPDRPTLTADELKAFAAALQQLDAIVVNATQAEAIQRALPDLAGKLKARDRYLPTDRRRCSQADDGSLHPMFCVPGR